MMATQARAIGAPRSPWIIVSAGFHEQGGQARATAALADYLLERGTPVHLVGHDIADRFLDRAGCTVHRTPRPAGADFLGVLMLRRRGRAVARQVRAAHPGSRVVVNGGNCQWGDVNWVHYVHHGWRGTPRDLPLRSRLKEAIAGTVFRRQERKALTAARLVVANSQQTRRLLLSGLLSDPARVHTIYYGSDPSWRPADPAERAAARAWLGQPPDRPLAVFVGGLGHDERKGFDTLWTAWQELCRAPSWDVDLLVAGSGATGITWQTRIASAGMSGRVRLLGFTERIFDVLAAADLLVSPVRYEPYGLNVQEAVCRGVPALVSARAGATERYTPDLAGMILPDPDDALDLAARLRAWRNDLAGWRERFAPLSTVLRSYSWRAMAEGLVDIVERSPTASARMS
jgi:glycosyltransferase involved in cell wall biosynthesis